MSDFKVFQRGGGWVEEGGKVELFFTMNRCGRGYNEGSQGSEGGPGERLKLGRYGYATCGGSDRTVVNLEGKDSHLDTGNIQSGCREDLRKRGRAAPKVAAKPGAEDKRQIKCFLVWCESTAGQRDLSGESGVSDDGWRNVPKVVEIEGVQGRDGQKRQKRSRQGHGYEESSRAMQHKLGKRVRLDEVGNERFNERMRDGGSMDFEFKCANEMTHDANDGYQEAKFGDGIFGGKPDVDFMEPSTTNNVAEVPGSERN